MQLNVPLAGFDYMQPFTHTSCCMHVVTLPAVFTVHAACSSILLNQRNCFAQVDWNKWVDEDEEDEKKDDFDMSDLQVWPLPLQPPPSTCLAADPAGDDIQSHPPQCVPHSHA